VVVASSAIVTPTRQSSQPPPHLYRLLLKLLGSVFLLVKAAGMSWLNPLCNEPVTLLPRRRTPKLPFQVRGLPMAWASHLHRWPLWEQLP